MFAPTFTIPPQQSKTWKDYRATPRGGYFTEKANMDNTHQEEAGWDNRPILFSLTCHFTGLNLCLGSTPFLNPHSSLRVDNISFPYSHPSPCPSMPALVHTGSSELYVYLSCRSNPSLRFCGLLTFSHLACGSIMVCCVT